MKIMTATDVSRGFSATLDAVEHGTEIRIMRGGRPVARLVPEGNRSTVAALTAAAATMPPVDPNAFAGFDDALTGIDMTPRNPWDEI
jgi:antitoxin (DNA-binding transcriptional repressor) of toxin-antitoxin stability system